MLILKRLFNLLFSEKVKEYIRMKFSGFLELLDKIILYREYKKACKYILKKKIFMYREHDYGWHHFAFMEYIKQALIETKIMYESFPVRDEEMQKCIDYVKENGADVYCGSLKNVQIYSVEDVDYDEENELYYGLYEGKRLYFDEAVDTKEKALRALNGLAAEQSENSPHKYLDGNFQVEKGDIVFDVGCADGNFALSVIEKAGKVYLFEADEHWMKPLRLTFAPYMEKVEIVKKYVDEHSGENAVSLDDFCRNKGIDHINMVKMDVEGYEESILKGADRLLHDKKIDKLAVCTYHKLDDEEKLGQILCDYDKDMARGYMLGTLIYEIYDIKPPYFTKGILRASIREK